MKKHGGKGTVEQQHDLGGKPSGTGTVFVAFQHATEPVFNPLLVRPSNNQCRMTRLLDEFDGAAQKATAFPVFMAGGPRKI